jgi:hypothetical protein
LTVDLGQPRTGQEDTLDRVVVDVVYGLVLVVLNRAHRLLARRIEKKLIDWLWPAVPVDSELVILLLILLFTTTASAPDLVHAIR